MQSDNIERRRGRRITLEAPVVLRQDSEQLQAPHEHVTKDVSLAGVYFEVEGDPPFAVNDVVMASVSVPESLRREFPFARVAGKSRVVRVSELEALQGRKRFGVAIEFGDDLTALTSIPSRG